MASEYVVLNRESFIVAMEELYSADDALARTDARILGVAGSVGIAIGCLAHGLSAKERKRIQRKYWFKSLGEDLTTADE